MIDWKGMALAVPLSFGALVQAGTTRLDADAAWDGAALQGVLEYAREQRSSALLIVQRSQVIAERYWSPGAGGGSVYTRMLWKPGETARPVEDVASVQKSVVSVLVGMAAERGLVDSHAAVSAYLGAGWSRAAPEREAAIQVRHLLSMSSGLTPDHEYQAPAGTLWRYNTRAYSRLVDVLEAVTEQGIDVLTARWLTQPLGMRDTAWRKRPWVTPDIDANQLGFYTTARDLALFGELMLSRGIWNGTRLVSEAYLRTATAPSQTLNPAYGLLWWLNSQPLESEHRRPGFAVLAPPAPSDLYAAQGALGRRLYVVPSLELVVVRLGDEPEADFNHVLWRHLMAAAPDEPVCVSCQAAITNGLAEARAADGSYITWRENVIDDRSRGVGDLLVSDGLAMQIWTVTASTTSCLCASRIPCTTAGRWDRCGSPAAPANRRAGCSARRPPVPKRPQRKM